MPEVSITVICSSYNAARFMPAYCESLDAQLLAEFRVCFVDAASSDGTPDIVEDHRFREGIAVERVRCTERIPVYEAWNEAVRRSRDSHVINYNCDDRLFPGALLTLAGYARRQPGVDLFYPRCFISTAPDHSTVAKLLNWPEHSHQRLLQICYGGPFPLVRRQAIVDAGYFDPRFSIVGDYEMWLRLSARGGRLQRVDECLGSYYQNPRGVSTDPASREARLEQEAEARALHRATGGDAP